MGKVVIVIPVYNGGIHLEKTLECALTQSHPNYEVLVINNGSTDNSKKTIDICLKKFPNRGHVITKEKPSGMVNDWNTAIKTALNTDAKYIKLLPADDILSQDCLLIQSKILMENPQLKGCFCPKAIITNGNKKKNYPWAYPNRVIKQTDLKELFYSPNNWLGEPGSLLAPASTWKTIGEFNPEFPYYADLHYWIRLINSGPVKITPMGTYWFRSHPGSLTLENNKKAAEEFVKLAESLGKKLNLIKDEDIPKIRRKAKIISLLRTLHQTIFAK